MPWGGGREGRGTKVRDSVCTAAARHVTQQQLGQITTASSAHRRLLCNAMYELAFALHRRPIGLINNRSTLRPVAAITETQHITSYYSIPVRGYQVHSCT